MPGVGRSAVIVLGVVALAVVGWVVFAYFRSTAAPRVVLATPTTKVVPGGALALAPPAGAEEAVALRGVGQMALAGAGTPTPIASVTKIMSALIVLRDHPLAPGAAGPAITVTPADVATYRLELSQGDSVVVVRAGEQLTELQALEAALIPSGDNVIELLADWDAGGSAAFTAKMNALARTFDLRHTHYVGPSGVDPATVSTAADQLRLAGVAMRNPVFASVVDMTQVNLPVAGVQYNVDADLGSAGINGIKTGWVPQGGASFVFSGIENGGGRRVAILGAVLGEQGATPLPTALATARRLVVAAAKTVRVMDLAAGSTVGRITATAQAPVTVVTASGVSLLAWAGAHAHLVLSVRKPIPSTLPAGARIGTLVVTIGSERRTTALVTTAALRAPSFGWRLEHF